MRNDSRTVAGWIRRSGGAVPVRELDAAGIRRDQLSDAVADGAVFRIRQRWYAVPDAPTDVVRAVRVGGAATATARANPPAPLDAARDDVCVHYRSDPPIRSGRDPLAVALAEMLHCTPTASVIATIDSALARGEVALAEIRAVAGPSRRRILDRCSDGSESGTETKVRLLLRARNIAHRTQVSIARVGRVDLLVGDRLVIEVDGSRHHSGREEFENDRRRDFELAMRGYVVLRLSYSMVVDEWEVTSRGILALIARGEHRWGVRSAPSVGLDVALRRLDRYDDAPPAAQFAGR